MSCHGVVDAMVELKAVTKSYGTTHALQPLNLCVRRGEFLSLLGPSGSGKTTLLNIIAGMISPSAGHVVIDGRDVTSIPPAQRGIGMVFQNYALMPHMTVFRNVAFPLEIRGLKRAAIQERVEQALTLVQLSHLAGRKPKELSGGQQQRVSIARCLVYNPSLILMDEPLGALDKSLREQMQLEIKRIHAQSRMTIVYVTHDQDEALNMSDRVLLMNAGTVEQIGTPQEIYAKPVSRFAGRFLGESTVLHGVVTGGMTMRLACGTEVEVAHGAQSGEGFLLLRPENLRLQAAGSVADDGNRIEGTLRDTLSNGGVVKHFVALDDGTDLTVRELANERRTSLTRGARVAVTWPVGAGLFLTR